MAWCGCWRLKPRKSVRLAWPRGRFLMLNKRWRSVKDNKTEEMRLAEYLCCPEELCFLGSVCTKAFLKHGESECPSEIYVGLSGRVYMYIDMLYSDALLVVAKDLAAFLKNGLKGCAFINVGSANMPSDFNCVSMTACANLDAFCAWRKSHLGQTMKLGDGTVFSVVSDSVMNWHERRRCTVDTGSFRMEPFGESSIEEEGRPIILFTDEYLRVYAKTLDGTILIASSMFEFVLRGLFRYRYDGIFYGNEKIRRLSRPPLCPNGLRHMCRSSVSSQLSNVSTSDITELPAMYIA
ncbi:tegument protein UL23 [Saimiriine betaherpesvirus 4]|uniref:Tegument protein UL23 n=1 Tax=Saimiriine betaherpesvirus 4 TaxID=1535247 RepID=G8XST7_9BETA|nr:tegument protein UL23 [Saimiriine betaherpesvirus 4]AEV80884.1 tegument protein UL23 [Saimiriine betaherpesvirus 4]